MGPSGAGALNFFSQRVARFQAYYSDVDHIDQELFSVLVNAGW